ncbi:uncharacterized protein LOC143231759 [Tachypleus tridentatus]|uniref:uncharacterized protein LOC143231759 n=1 Tax=Tachypleus tridentatus TaxID=6853 RepID=UPI003FD0055C
MEPNMVDNSFPGGHLLIILSNPHNDDHKECILKKVSKGLLSWDVSKTGCNLIGLKDAFSEELRAVGAEDFLIQYSKETLAVEVLLNPKVMVLKQSLKNMLSSLTTYKHIIHAGYSSTGSGSWILQDGVFTFKLFIEILSDPGVHDTISKIPQYSVHVHCTAEGDWCERNVIENLTCVSFNPPHITSFLPGHQEFLDYLKTRLTSQPLEEIMKPSPVVGNIRFCRPSLYVFPGGDGDCSLFGISGFNMLINGGFERKPCFWDFVRHIDRLDAMIITTVSENNLNGISSLIKRKQKEHVFPHVGYVFCNIMDSTGSSGEEVTKDKDELLVSLLAEGYEFLNDLWQLNLKPHLCFRENDTDPLTLYHKMGHGTLDMYVLNPSKNSREVKDFFQYWSSKKDSISEAKGVLRLYNEVPLPLLDLVSISVLLVWRPAKPKDLFTRILVTGNTPQTKIFEGLKTIKDLDVLQQFDCSQSVLQTRLADVSELTENSKETVAKAFPKLNNSSSQKKVIYKSGMVPAQEDKVNKHTSERKTPDSVKVSTKKSIDSEKIGTKLREKTLEPNKDILPKCGTSTNKGKASQFSNVKNTVKPTTKFGKKTKGAKDVSNKKIAEKEIVDKNGKIETKTKRPETTTKLSRVSKVPIEKTPMSFTKPSEKSHTLKVIKQTQHTDMNVKKQVDDNLTSARRDENSRTLENRVDISLDNRANKKDTDATLDKITNFQHQSVSTVVNTDAVNYSESALFQPSDELVEQYEDSLDSVSGNDKPLRELDEETNIQLEKSTTGANLTETTRCGETLFRISDRNFECNEEIHIGISYDKEIDKQGKRQSVIGLSSSETSPLYRQGRDFIQPEAFQEELNENVQERADYRKQIELVHEAENSYQLITDNTFKISDETLQVNSMGDKVFTSISAAYPFLRDGSPLSEEQKSTFPIRDFNFHSEKNKTRSNQLSSYDVDLNIDNTKLSENEDSQVEFDQRNTEDEMEDSLEMLVEKKPKVVKQEDMFPGEKNMELPKDNTHVPCNQLGVQSETHTSEREYSATETLDAVSDDILPEDGTPGGETEKSFDQSFWECFTDSSRENHLEVKEAVDTTSTENKMVATRVLKEDEAYLTSVSLNRDGRRIQDKEYELCDEDDGEMIRYPTPPGIQGFYEHIGYTSRLKEDHIGTDSYVLQYDIRTHPFQICEDLTVQPLYEEPEEEDDNSERLTSPLVEEPVYGSAMRADYPEMVNISESSTPSEPHSPLDSKYKESGEKQNEYPVNHSFFLDDIGESLNDSSITELEQKETEETVKYLIDSLQQQSIDQTCENTNVTYLCSQTSSSENNFVNKTKDTITWDIMEQTSKRDEPNYKGRDFVLEQNKHASLSCPKEYCEDRYNQKDTVQIAHIDSMQNYSNNVCEKPASGVRYGALETFPDNLVEEDKKLPNFAEDSSQACDRFGDPNTSQSLSEMSCDVRSREMVDLGSLSGLYPLNKEQTSVVSYGLGTIPSYQSSSSSTRIQNQINYGELQPSHDVAVKEPINFTRHDYSSSFTEHDSNFYDEGQASTNKHPISKYFSEEEVGNVKDGVSPILSQSDLSDAQSSKSLQLDEKNDDFSLDKWDKPMGLPTPPDYQNIAKRGKVPPKTVSNEPSKTPVSNYAVKKELPNGKNIPRDFVKVASSKTKKTSSAGRSGDLASSELSHPVYVDLAYVPNHGDPNYCDEEFFRKIRARYYVFSGINPAKEGFNALLEAKKYWEDTEVEVTIVPTYETDVLGYWIALNEEMLAANKIGVAPSANRCTINLQDHDASCAAYRIDF